MKEFMGRDFLLKTETARHLYHDYAEKMPIIDYHCHISQKEIYENRRFKTITDVWLGGDHYKWRQMRANGIDEKYITGDASDLEKFKAWAATLSRLIGTHLAFGKAYPTCIKGGADMDTLTLLSHGVNDSLLHEDFMVGSRDLSIMGKTKDGKEIPVFRNGNFTEF